MQPRATLDRCTGCGRPVETHRLFCTACGRPIGRIGFWLRPAVAFGKKLSFSSVLSRGLAFQGLDTALRATAEASFNRMVIGAMIGAVVGICVLILVNRFR